MEILVDPKTVDALITTAFDAARVPGGAVAIVADGKMVFAKGYGTYDEARALPVGIATLYPIASTTKAINATLIGMLIDDGMLGWDDPVQRHLPHFRLRDPIISSLVTIRDCLAMRTGLPRHDWVWLNHDGAREDLVERFAHLELTAGHREKYQYNNLTVTLTGVLAESVTGKTWEELVMQRILEPLGMTETVFGRTGGGDVTSAWHERADRTLLPTEASQGDITTAPAGGSIHSTVLDMAHWMAFNLNGGKVGQQQLIRAETLREIHRPQMVVGDHPVATSPDAAYGLGWFVDHYNGCPRILHSGYLDDISSNVELFPEQGIGIVCFSNFGPVRASSFITSQIFDCVIGLPPRSAHVAELAEYERKVAETKMRNDTADRVNGTRPSHPLTDYAGRYAHPGYGEIEISSDDRGLCLHVNKLEVPLEHWHYDAWVAVQSDIFAIHAPHCFDRHSRIIFGTDPSGTVSAVTIPFEPDASPIAFTKTAPFAERICNGFEQSSDDGDFSARKV